MFDFSFHNEPPNNVGPGRRPGGGSKYDPVYEAIRKAHDYAVKEGRDTKSVCVGPLSSKTIAVRVQSAAAKVNPTYKTEALSFKLPEGWLVSTSAQPVNGNPDGEYYTWITVYKVK